MRISFGPWARRSNALILWTVAFNRVLGEWWCSPFSCLREDKIGFRLLNKSTHLHWVYLTRCQQQHWKVCRGCPSTGHPQAQPIPAAAVSSVQGMVVPLSHRQGPHPRQELWIEKAKAICSSEHEILLVCNAVWRSEIPEVTPKLRILLHSSLGCLQLAMLPIKNGFKGIHQVREEAWRASLDHTHSVAFCSALAVGLCCQTKGRDNLDIFISLICAANTSYCTINLDRHGGYITAKTP